MKYIHIKKDHYYQGLPAGDLDDADLNDSQKLLLSEAVVQGVYAAAKPAREAGRKPTRSQGETNVSEPDSGHTE